MAEASHSIEIRALLNSMKKFSIYRLPANIRQRRTDYYEPQVVSIGPYSHRKRHLKASEAMKVRCLIFMMNTFRCNRDDCFTEMEKLGGKAMDCYSEKTCLFRESHLFADMLMQDGCYILKVMLDHYYNEDRRVNDHWIINDLLMLENQIPFFVLKKLFEYFNLSSMTRGPPTLVHLAFQYLKPATMRPNEENRVIDEVLHCEFEHLLHLYYCFMSTKANEIRSSSQLSPLSRANIFDLATHFDYSPLLGNEMPDSRILIRLVNFLHKLCCIIRRLILLSLGLTLSFIRVIISSLGHISIWIFIGLCHCGSVWLEQPPRQYQYLIRSATELQEADVTLWRRESPSSLWDVHFKDGILQIPPVLVDKSMKPLLMNLVAFEQYADMKVLEALLTQEQRTLESSKKFTAYAIFMGCIVYADKDATTLRLEGIIQNKLENEQAVVDFFHHLREEVDHQVIHYFSGMFADMNKYCEPHWRRYKARLMHDCFGDPWKVIKLVISPLLFVITIFTALVGYLKYFKPSHSD